MTAFWWKLGGGAALIGLLLGLLHEHDQRQRAEGARAILLRQTDSTIAAMTDSLNAYHTTHQRRDTVFVPRQAERGRQRLAQVQPLIDSLCTQAPETVRVQIAAALATADSSLTECPLALERCTRALSLAERRDTVRVREIRLLTPTPQHWYVPRQRDGVIVVLWEAGKWILRQR